MNPLLSALAPWSIAAALPALLLLTTLVRRPGLALGVSLAGYAAVLASLPWALQAPAPHLTPLLALDGPALLFLALSVVAGAVTALLADAQWRTGGSALRDDGEVFYLLLSLSVLGAGVLAASRHFATLFLGLELLSLPLFALIAFARGSATALEAAIKYLVLSSIASALLLFGLALLYAGLGSLAFNALGKDLSGAGSLWSLGGLGLVLAGLAMKLSLVPLHWWTPDVFQGAPTPVGGFLASVSKGAVVMLLLRLLSGADAATQATLAAPLGVIAIVSMLGGNLLALWQRDLKRILAGSSIAHLGYLLVALLATGELAAEAVGFYLAAYFVTTLGAFGALALLRGTGQDGGSDSIDQEALRGLYQRRPWLTLSLTLSLLSLAGLPLTAGFVGKFYLFAAGLDARLWVLVGVLLVASLIGLFYYLRLIALLFNAPRETMPPILIGSWSGGACFPVN
ncbi:MAG: NADH-quinone oxidoreductase subunit N [Chromatiales bacterium]|jgi:NADH-quinone oxidoreductase subunit N